MIESSSRTLTLLLFLCASSKTFTSGPTPSRDAVFNYIFGMLTCISPLTFIA